MSTATDERVEVDLEDMLDESLPCDDVWEDCPRPVMFFVRKDFCGHTAVYCKFHIFDWLAANSSWKDNKPVAICITCHQRSTCTILPM